MNSELETIKNEISRAIAAGEKHAFITIDGREGLIMVKNYGDAWFERATLADIERVTVY